MAGTTATAGTPVVINDNGSVTAHGPKAWIWCTDESTGARMDIPAWWLPKAGLKPVPHYPVNTKKVARDSKSALDLSTSGETDAPKTTSKKGAGQ